MVRTFLGNQSELFLNLINYLKNSYELFKKKLWNNLETEEMLNEIDNGKKDYW